MTDTANSQAAGGHALLVRFAWGSAGSAAYTTWSAPLTAGGIAYAPEPRLEAEAGKQTGGVHDEPWSVTMVDSLSPAVQLARRTAFAPVACRIAECDPTAATVEEVVLWAGDVSIVTNRLKDKPGCVRLQVAGRRARVQSPMGTESKTACSRTFGDRWCGVDLSAVVQTATITAVSGKTLSAPSLVVPAGRPANYFSWGKVIVDGLAIGIIDGSGGPAALGMFQPPPPEWIGATALVYPGCDKSYGGRVGCTGWDNTDRFFGLGIVKPSQSPSLTPR